MSPETVFKGISTAELFLFVEELGIDTSQLRKAEGIIDREQLRAALHGLIKARITRDAYREFSISA